MAYNAGDEKQVEQKIKENKLARTSEIEDLKEILSRPSGIRFFKRFFTEAKIFSTSFTGNSTTFFLEGRRDLALKILGDITDASPEKISEILINKKEE